MLNLPTAPPFGLKYIFKLIKHDILVSDFHGLVNRTEFGYIKILGNILKSGEKTLM